MNKEKYDWIFFDFDGVIVDSVDVKTKAFYDLYLPHGKEIAEKVMAHHVEHSGISRFVKFKQYHQDFLGVSLTDTSSEYVKLLNDFSNKVEDAVVNCPYVKGALDFLKIVSVHSKCFIITGTPQNEIERILKRRGLDSYFIEVGGAPKKKIEWVSELSEKYHIDLKRSCFFGDALADYEAAKHFNIPFILRECDLNYEFFKTKNDCARIQDFTPLLREDWARQLDS